MLANVKSAIFNQKMILYICKTECLLMRVNCSHSVAFGSKLPNL